MKSLTLEKFLLLVLIAIGVAVLVIPNLLTIQPHQQFVDLAQAFLHGQLSFLPTARSVYDASIFEGKSYWPLGPLPAVLLMPFVVVFGTSFQLGYLQFVLILAILYLAYKVAAKILGNTTDALWLSFGYIFSSAFLGVAVYSFSWQFAQVVATLLLFASIYEFFYKKRWILIGLFLGLAVAVRMDLILGIVFFAGSILLSHAANHEKIIKLAKFFIPIGLSVALLLLYNYLRFHNFFDQGYLSQHLANPLLLANRTEAVWSIIHIPANLYYFLLRGPDGVFQPGTQILTFPFLRENPWGMSILFTSPLFLWIIKAPFRKKEVFLAGITALLIAIAIFGYYGIGFAQFGYRYALDFYPFLFIMLLYALHLHASQLLKAIIILSFYFNLYLLITI